MHNIAGISRTYTHEIYSNSIHVHSQETQIKMKGYISGSHTTLMDGMRRSLVSIFRTYNELTIIQNTIQYPVLQHMQV